MRALTWQGIGHVSVETVPDPKIINPGDAILKVSTTNICGSDLHLLDGFIPALLPGDVLGHEFMGEIVDVGSSVKNVRKGDRVIVPFNIACGQCFFCKKTLFAACDNSNPKARATEKTYGAPANGMFGYTHLFGGYAGGQAEYVRVPFADVGPLKIPESLTDEQVVFLTDIFPTGYMAAENCNIQEGDTVAVWGCGPVAQFAIASAKMLGAHQVIAIDDVPERLAMARKQAAITIDVADEYVYEKLMHYTGGRGPDSVIDAVGMEAHGQTLDAWLDNVKAKMLLATDRTHALRQAINCCRKGGTVSIPGVYGGFADKFPLGAAFGKGLTFKMGQTHTHRYTKKLLDHVIRGDIDPTFVITHRAKLAEAPAMYAKFRDKQDGCIKVVMTP
jgi:threonine dehydrogenase-like Zn-dependent dehydrogenase